MRILILGGTVFLGRAVTDAALAARHTVTHLNRGRSAPPDPRVETIVGDRTAIAFDVLERKWDAVIDTSGYHPKVVGRSAAGLRGRAGRYLFVSSISAYRSFDRAGFDEDAPLAPPPDPLPEERTPETYGPLKAMCEAVVRGHWEESALIVRPGLIVGPNDPTDRFTHWPVRVARGGRVAAPGRPGRLAQFIDVRDLAEWMIALVEREARGTFNATGPRRPIAMEDLLEACRSVAASDTGIEWIEDDFLLARKVEPWIEMPLWIPENDPEMHGLMACSIDRALAAGLAFRPLAEPSAKPRSSPPGTRRARRRRQLPSARYRSTMALRRSRSALIASSWARIDSRSVSSTSKRLTAPLS